MELHLYGDHIENGEYKVHSTFSNVVNLVKGDDLLTLASAPVNAGPFNIIFNKLTISNFSQVIISNYEIIINNYSYRADNNKIWSSVYHFPETDLQTFKNKLEIIYNELKDLLPENSLIFAPEKADFSQHLKGFEKELAESMKDGIVKLFGNNTEEGIKSLRGKGKGLTPAGDDFLTGYLYALYTVDKMSGSNTEKIRKETYQLSRTSNLISDSQLKAAANGWFTANIKTLLDRIFNKNNIELKDAIAPLLSCGATSGADMMAGFILTFKHLTYN